MKAYSPEAAAKLPPEAITHLYIHNRNLRELPKQIFEYKNLKELDLSNNQIEFLPTEIEGLTNLVSLNLRLNSFKEFPNAVFNLPQLKILNFSENELAELPDSFDRLPNLEGLFLSHNRIQTLPKSLAKSTRLTTLFLAFNQIKKLPAGFKKSGHLESLNLSGNRFSRFPEVISEFKNLTFLYLGKNRISEIPESLLNCQNLRNLDLHKNKLTSVPSFIGQFGRLQKLHLDENQLNELPDSFENLSRLRHLSFSKNNLTHFPEFLPFLIRLERLDFSFNKISQIPDSTARLTNLRSLKLTKNNFSNFPNAVLSLNALKSIDRCAKIPGRKITYFIKNCVEANIPESNRRGLFQVLFFKKENEFRALSLSDLSPTLSFKQKKIRDLARQIIFERFEKAYEKSPLKKGCQISISGKTTLRKTDLISRIKSAGLILEKEISEKTTHLVLGDGAKIELGKLPRNAVFISEKRLNDWLIKHEKPWLLDSGNAKSVQNLSKLLLSNQDQNIELALKMMTTGGVPKSILTDVLIARKRTQKTGLKNKLTKILEMNVSEKGMELVRFRRGFLSETDWKTKITELAGGTEFDGERLIKGVS